MSMCARGSIPSRASPSSPAWKARAKSLAVGDGVTDFAPGDRVAYAGPIGGYAEDRLIPADRLVKLPDDLSYETGAAMMLKGMTAAYLLRRVYDVRPGIAILFHAAAGGVGLIACQWAKALGATVIGTVGSAEKAALARCPWLRSRHQLPVGKHRRAGPRRHRGEGVDVVYDGVGKDTFAASLDSLKPFGLFASFGQTSGTIPPFDLRLLGTERLAVRHANVAVRLHPQA